MGLKYAADEKFFEKWSDPMAYVLGYLYADGSLEDASYLRGKYLRVSSTDWESIIRLRKLLKSEHGLVVLKPTKSHPGKTRYLLRIGSHKIYNDLIKLGMYPNKSLTVKFPSIPKKYLSHFIRGYFDGDGCVYLYKTKGKKKPEIVKKLSIIFTSGSYDFLRKLCNILRASLKLNQLNIYRGKGAYQLRYSTHDSIKIFEFMYHARGNHIFLLRKFEVFKNYFNLRPSNIKGNISKILNYNN